ncbi:hypothetical protein PL78_09245 [Yersinia entomophaga]|uniref:Head completion/stabilization protein n=1 Tax=Yersinia entomophaga TaxID=935293 RepID=A0ABM6BKV2_YERET|nr:head completion/stabilization protein [Yersinia entomophaga]ANI30003.1 hypothetical protein PL78_09245 [Yersinia entomophaga]OWF87112.1 hypothetical protein B4914_12900 [Yersinia entomophaga]
MNVVLQPSPDRDKSPVSDSGQTMIKNTEFWPDIDLNKYRDDMRQDGTLSQPRVIEAARFAIHETNRRLADWQRARQKQGYFSLTTVPASQLDGESVNVQLYRRAVYCLMQASLTERFRSIDATGSGSKRADSLETTIDALRRDAAWAINDIQAINRMTCELI